MVATEILGVWGVQLNLFEVTRLLRKYANNKFQEKSLIGYLNFFDKFIENFPEAENWRLGDVPDEASDFLNDLTTELSGFWKESDGFYKWRYFYIDLGENHNSPLTIYRLPHDLSERAGNSSATDLFILGEEILSWNVKSSFAPTEKGGERWEKICERWEKIYKKIEAITDPRDEEEIDERQALLVEKIPELVGKEQKMHVYQDDCTCCS